MTRPVTPKRAGCVRPVIVVAVAVALASSAFAAPPAGANFADALTGDCYNDAARQCFANSTTHIVDWDLGPRTGVATYATLFQSYNTTDLTISIPEGVTVDDDAHSVSIDVYYTNGSLTGLLALTSCLTWSGHLCTHWHVTYDSDALYGRSDNFLQFVACHETGHTVGLTHPNLDPEGYSSSDPVFACMTTSAGSPINLGAHNVHHINSRY